MAKKKGKKPDPRFYQTVVVRKVQAPEETVDAETTAAADGPSSGGDNDSGPLKETATSEGVAQPVAEKEVDPQTAKLQDIVTQLQEKTEKEITRTLKAIEFDRRQTDSFTRLEIDKSVRARILELIKESELDPDVTKLRVKGLDDAEEKVLGRLGITYGVLMRLGFTEARVDQCLGAITGVELEEAYDWLYLACDEAELLSTREDPATKDSYKIPQTPRTGTGTQTPATPLFPPTPTSVHTPSLAQSMPSRMPSSSSVSTTENAPSAQKEMDSAIIRQRILADYGSSAEPQDGEDKESEDDESEDDDPSMAYARLKLRLTVQSRDAAANAPEIVRIKKRLEELKADYFFKQKDADREFQIRLKEMEDAALLARLRNLSASDPAPAVTPEDRRQKTPVARPKLRDIKTASRPTEISTPSDTQDDEPMFGNLLDTPSPETAPTGVTITIRNMELPRQWAGRTPKKLFEETVHRLERTASISYTLLSGASRAVRAGATVRFPGGRTQQFEMIDVGCPDKLQAEQYISLVALHALTFPPQAGFASGGNGNAQTFFRLLPPVFLDLWYELEEKRKQSEEDANRTIWSKLLDIVELKRASLSKSSSKVKKVDTRDQDADPSSSQRRGPSQPSEQLMLDFYNRQMSIGYQEMLVQRNTLPIAPFRQQIMEALHYSQVIVLSGETGCGKSTQLPSFILEHQLSQGMPCKILCTEPRRISAITLAQRVSRELGDAPGAVGTMASLVGYSIRLESNTSRNTRLTYCTNGIALRMLEDGSGRDGNGMALDDITHIIIDEVHERSIESDFLLIILKSLLEHRPDLKVVLMSATVDADKVSAYFGNCPTLLVPGRTFPVDVRFLEDAVDYTGWSIKDNSPYAAPSRKAKGKKNWSDWNEDAVAADEDDDNAAELQPGAKLGKRYSATTVSTMNILDQRLIPYDLIIRLLERICFEDPSHLEFSPAILIFCPGLAEIRRISDLLSEHPSFGGDEFRIYPLHSTISSENQSAAFDIPPRGVRKIVIATNIAETGVTIPDVTCVIDTGKHRETRFDEKRQISRLTETFIARSNAAQRRGRAGRVQSGLCFHLFTRHRHDNILAEHPEPEMMRLSLSDLALRIKILRLKIGSSIEDVLSRALDPPASINIQRAVSALVEVKALTPSEDITPMGRLLSKLPTDVHLGKFLLLATVMRCLDPALTIAATLNAKSPFITPFGQEDEAERAKSRFKVDNSDFLTIHAAFAAWRNIINKGGSARKFCRDNYLSHQNLQQVEEIRQQLLGYLLDSGFIDADKSFQRELSKARFSRKKTNFVGVPPDLDIHAEDNAIVNAALNAGLYPKIISVNPKNGEMRTLSNNQAVSFHPSSVNFGFRRKPQDIGVQYLSFFTIMHSSKLYAWETGPVDDMTLLLVCGDAEFKLIAESGVVDRKLKYQLSPKTAVALKYLRKNLTSIMAIRMKEKELTPMQERWYNVAMDILGHTIFE